MNTVRYYPEVRPPLTVIAAGNIARVRREKGWSQERLSRACHLSRETIRAVEQAKDGVHGFRLYTLEIIGDALGVNPVELLRYDAETTRAYLQRLSSLSLVTS